MKKLCYGIGMLWCLLFICKHIYFITQGCLIIPCMIWIIIGIVGIIVFYEKLRA